MKRILLSLSALALALSCTTTEELTAPTPQEEGANQITVEIAANEASDAATKIEVAEDGDSWLVSWSDGDGVSAWSYDGAGGADSAFSQFTMDEKAEDGQSATFTGSTTYNNVRFVYPATTVDVPSGIFTADLSAQSVDMDAPLAGLANYTYMVSSAAIDTSSDDINPSMSHVGSALEVMLGFENLDTDSYTYTISSVVVGGGDSADGYAAVPASVSCDLNYAVSDAAFYNDTVAGSIAIAVSNSPSIIEGEVYEVCCNIAPFAVATTEKIMLTVYLDKKANDGGAVEQICESFDVANSSDEQIIFDRAKHHWISKMCDFADATDAPSTDEDDDEEHPIWDWFESTTIESNPYIYSYSNMTLTLSADMTGTWYTGAGYTWNLMNLTWAAVGTESTGELVYLSEEPITDFDILYWYSKALTDASVWVKLSALCSVDGVTYDEIDAFEFSTASAYHAFGNVNYMSGASLEDKGYYYLKIEIDTNDASRNWSLYLQGVQINTEGKDESDYAGKEPTVDPDPDPDTDDVLFSGGEGTAELPYLISTVEDMELLSSNVSGGEYYTGIYFSLENNINLGGSESNQWAPIGDTYDTAFKGVFNGNGHKISGLYINVESSYQALFGYLGAVGVIKNLLVEGDVTNTGINESTDANNTHAAILVSYSYGTVINCGSYGTVNGVGNFCAGTVGYSNSTTSNIINCYNQADVKAIANVGGISAAANKTVLFSNCYNTGIIAGSSYVGAVLGRELNSPGIGYVYTLEGTWSQTSSNNNFGYGYYFTDAADGVFTDEYMQSDEFVALLNANVEEYNATSPTHTACTWVKVEGGYPTFATE